jgi:formate dehydrogenase iron-sulfur subunit
MAEMAIFYDSSKCTACKGCQVACKQWNQLPSPLVAEEFEFTKSYQSPLVLEPATWVIIEFNEFDQEIGVDWNFMRRSCFHCTDAACEQACPVGAITHRENGAVVIDQDKCIGCKYCVNSCPFGVPNWDAATNKTFKCWLCQDRIENGLRPACVTICPTGALTFGPRDEMLSTAEARLDTLVQAGFDNAELYGRDEVDGMHVLFIAQRGVEDHGLQKDPQVPAITNAWQVLKPIGGAAAILTAGGLGLSFLSSLSYEHDEEEVE